MVMVRARARVRVGSDKFSTRNATDADLWRKQRSGLGLALAFSTRRVAKPDL